MDLELGVSPYRENGVDGTGRHNGDWDNTRRDKRVSCGAAWFVPCIKCRVSSGRGCDWQDMWHSWHEHMERPWSNIWSKRTNSSCWVQIILKWTPTILLGLDYVRPSLDINRRLAVVNTETNTGCRKRRGSCWRLFVFKQWLALCSWTQCQITVPFYMNWSCFTAAALSVRMRLSAVGWIAVWTEERLTAGL